MKKMEKEKRSIEEKMREEYKEEPEIELEEDSEEYYEEPSFKLNSHSIYIKNISPQEVQFLPPYV